jgi:DNA-directed RNA polymerase subunit RPC12/RpoP
MNGFKERFARFMIGRYGMDRLGQFLNAMVCVFLAAGLFSRSKWLDIGALLFLVLCYFRVFSKNIGKRFEENQKFERIWFQVSEVFRRWRFKLQQSRKYHIYKCPNCKQKIRIPRGKGKISIHCPKCGTDFIKKS